MVASVLTGPDIIAGTMFMAGSSSEYNPDAGPSIVYQGDALPDVRYSLPKDNLTLGSVRAHLSSPYILMTDAVPAASAATPVNIAAAANVTNGTAMTLVTVAGAGISPNTPLLPFGASTVVNALALDFGFTTVNTTSGSTTVTITTPKLFYPGQWLVIPNGATPTTTLITQVVSVGTTTMVVSVAPGVTNSSLPVGSGNIFSPYFGGNPATYSVPYIAAGVAAIADPAQTISRGIGIAGSTSAVGGTFVCKGYDLYGQAQTENVIHPGGTAVQYGRKTWKFISSITPQFSDANNYSVGTSDVFGFSVRNDKWEYDNFYVAGAFLTVSTGWTAADTTSPATATTGDVRGTIQVGTRGSLGSGASGGPMDGVKRLALFASIPAYNLTNTTPINPSPFYGVTPF